MFHRGKLIETPRLSAVVMISCDGVFDARCMAAPIVAASRNVTAQMVEPEPLRNAPSAPAFSAAATTFGKNGINFARNG